MVRAIVLYEAEPDAERYARHLEEFTPPVECSAFPPRQGLRLAVRGAARLVLRRVRVGGHGDVQAGGGSPEFAAAGADAMAMGIPFTVQFAEIS